MPLYEYVCSNCGALFEHWVRSASVAEAIICPHCQSTRVDKKFSTFGVKGSVGNSNPSAGDACSTGGG